MTSALLAQNNVQRIAREIGVIGALTGLTVLASKIALVLPWTPVPATLQTAAVIFAGAAFGSRRAMASQIAYLFLGLCGAPVFASWIVSGPAVLATPSFGFLLAFPLAAWLAGRWTSRSGRWLGALASLGAIYAIGSLWLFAWAAIAGLENPLAWVLWAGVLPFLPFCLLKASLAVFSAIPIRKNFAG